MPTKIFNVLDATLFSQTTDGTVTISNGGAPTIASLLSLVAVGSWDFLADFTGTMSGGFASVVTTGLGRVEQIIDINYTKVLTGLPAGAKIKKMVINTPYSINVDIEADNNYSLINLEASGSITTIVNGISNNVSPGITTGTGGPPITDLLVAGIAAVGSVAANHIVFDLTGGGSSISRTDFITNYGRITIRNNIFINSVINNIFGATNVDCIYASSLGIGWTITITYENTFNFTFGPQVKNEESPSETVYSITDASQNSVDIPLNTITGLLAYYTTGGGIPTVIAFTLTNVPSNPLDPQGNRIYFTLPGIIPVNDNVVIMATGTQFSGEVQVGYIFAELVDGSGLYRLDFDKHYDTYYDRSITPVETVNVTIPSPFGRNGFF